MNAVNIPGTWNWIKGHLEKDEEFRQWFRMEKSADGFCRELDKLADLQDWIIKDGGAK